MYTVTREINFCYGHRLLNHPGKCRHLHGHNGKLQIELYAESLNPCEMVKDFDEIKSIVQTWIDETLDHKMILFKDDPLIPSLEQLGESHLVIERHPTAEVLSKMIFDYANSQNLPVLEVRLWESEKSCATYRK